MRWLKKHGAVIWRVPLIAVVSGFFYARIYVAAMVRFGVSRDGVLDDRVSLLVSAVIFLAVLAAGGILLLRNQPKKEILLSAAMVSLYGILLLFLQRITGSTSGPRAIVFLHLNRPLEWTGFFSSAAFYAEQNWGISLPFLNWIRFAVPFLFVLFGRKKDSAS